SASYSPRKRSWAPIPSPYEPERARTKPAELESKLRRPRWAASNPLLQESVQRRADSARVQRLSGPLLSASRHRFPIRWSRYWRHESIQLTSICRRPWHLEGEYSPRPTSPARPRPRDAEGSGGAVRRR